MENIYDDIKTEQMWAGMLMESLHPNAPGDKYCAIKVLYMLKICWEFTGI